ncbi:MAG: type II toxin-antitoxin system RelE/ParE family toxin [Candidatus Kapabacteria bacterium]|nr:type II toxin-antitoxin system RelE/ParE family toxin [Ignavibacteriota bacterium]MCW5884094.1 type II toxin-antitoxin system RelE/ParE family toxin [Candidatus Kapabacteria bacterium]
MTYIIKWSEKSKNDFIEIVDYLLINWGNYSAKKFKNKVFKSIELILKFPSIYPITEYRKNLRRCIVVKQVSLYYQVKENDKEIYLVRFIDNRRATFKISKSLYEAE